MFILSSLGLGQWDIMEVFLRICHITLHLSFNLRDTIKPCRIWQAIDSTEERQLLFLIQKPERSEILFLDEQQAGKGISPMNETLLSLHTSEEKALKTGFSFACKKLYI